MTDDTDLDRLAREAELHAARTRELRAELRPPAPEDWSGRAAQAFIARLGRLGERLESAAVEVDGFAAAIRRVQGALDA